MPGSITVDTCYCPLNHATKGVVKVHSVKCHNIVSALQYFTPCVPQYACTTDERTCFGLIHFQRGGQDVSIDKKLSDSISVAFLCLFWCHRGRIGFLNSYLS